METQKSSEWQMSNVDVYSLVTAVFLFTKLDTEFFVLLRVIYAADKVWNKACNESFQEMFNFICITVCKPEPFSAQHVSLRSQMMYQ